MTKSTIIASSLLFGFTSTPSIAATLATPMIFVENNRAAICIVTNPATSDATVQVRGIDINGTNQVPINGTCPNAAPGTLAAGTSCWSDVACVFEVKGKVRASIQLYDTGNNVIMGLPATK